MTHKLLALFLLVNTSSLIACGDSSANIGKRSENVLRVASWDEYIDMGGENSYYDPDSKPLYEEFESWYYEQYGKKIKVEYIALQDNETMYGKIKMGDEYDLLCPSEYMIMKLASEKRLEKYPESFFDATIEHNYYIQNLSPYIQDVFNNKLPDGRPWSEYAAGYFWGTTGFVFNPKEIGKTEDVSREIMKSWSCLTNQACHRKITAKDNVRDSYFMGLGMYYENTLLALKNDYEQGKIDLQTYQSTIAAYMNDTSEKTMAGVKSCLEKMRKNLYGLETDEGKLDVIAGRLDASYQWSGDAVFILDEAEENDLFLEYSIPDAVSNLWFDGWVMMKGANVEAATAFVNFLSMPENVVRNMYYTGYTSCIGGNTVFEYVTEAYGDEDGNTQYDLSYFFGDNHILTTNASQTRRQLFAQYPSFDVIPRLVTMNYFDTKTNERANRMWNNIK